MTSKEVFAMLTDSNVLKTHTCSLNLKRSLQVCYLQYVARGLICDRRAECHHLELDPHTPTHTVLYVTTIVWLQQPLISEGVQESRNLYWNRSFGTDPLELIL